MTTQPNNSNTVILIPSDGMGKGEPKLQHKLIGVYLNLLMENAMLPAAICFFTEGVRLVTDASPVLEQLRALEKRGVRLVVCSTCLNYYNLADQVQVGIVGGMSDILEYQWGADRVITI